MSNLDPLKRWTWIVGTCLLMSGTGSLVLEVVWSRLLKLVFGSTTLAVSTILVAYMLGLGLGGLLGGRVAGRLRNGIRVYGFIEIGIAAYALLVPFLLGLYPYLNRAVLAPLSFWPAALVRFLLVLIVLLAPTILMGATLPILVQTLARGSAQLGQRVGLLYGINTLGAVLGVVLSTFFLFPAIGLRLTNLTGAALDLLVGLIAIFLIAPAMARLPSTTSTPAVPAVPLPVGPELARWNPALLSYGVVGFTALAYEVCWTRALTMVSGSSIYAFATILAAFLLGIALGSLIVRYWVDHLRSHLVAYGYGLALLGATSLITMLSFRDLPDLLAGMFTERGVTGATLLAAEIRASLLVVLAPTLVLGALFPLLARALAGRDGDHGRVVGDIYFVNTLGSALGAFLAGFVLIPTIGLRWTMTLAIAANFLVAAAVLLWQRQRTGALRWAPAAVALAVGVLVLVSPPTWSAKELSRGIYYNPINSLELGITTETFPGRIDDEMLFYREGVNATISIHRTSSGIDMRINGKTDASEGDMRTQVLCGHLPVVFGGPVSRALVIGFASGTTTGALALHEPERIDVIEIEPAIIEASKFFEGSNHRPLARDNVNLVLDDARSYLSHTSETYDLVISQPSNPWISGNANLFTREFFREVSRVLRPEGRLLQWFQLYGMDVASVKSVLAAVHSEFPYVYGFLATADNSDFLMIAAHQPLRFQDLVRWEALPDAVRRDLARFNFASTSDLWSLLRLTPAQVGALAAEAEFLNTDDGMQVELRAPWHLYDPSNDVRAAFDTYTRGILALFPRDLSGDDLSEIALSHLWLRGDRHMAMEVGSEAQHRGKTALSLVAGAEWKLQRDPSDPYALDRLDEAVELDPDCYHARYARARVLSRQDLLGEALADIDHAVALQPERWEARRLRMDILLVMRRHAAARAEAEILLASPYAEVDRKLLADAALLAGITGRFEEGLEEMERFLVRSPNSPDEWTWMAQVLRGLRRPDEAKQARDNADIAARNATRGAHRRARWLELIGEIDEAKRGLRWVLERDPGYEPALLDLERLEADAAP